MHTLRAIVLVGALAVAGCGSGDTLDTTPEQPPGAETPTATVEGLIEAINEPDFPAAGRLSVAGQAALAALAEGATIDEVAESLEGDDGQVSANFWSGFAQGAGGFLTGEVSAADEGLVEGEGFEFHSVSVQSADGEPRTLLISDEDGYRVDIFASFGSALADKMIAPVERLLTTQTEDSRLILNELQAVVPSLLAAASQPGTSATASQQILALVEVITRVR
ncbi:MAG TPA: hypothetical protein VMM14_08420 [Acidimicrobiia bacterium]|nr:hypothetical protein [Acidimicrobiia bacterium]